MFGVFKPPETRAQRRAAKCAQALREEAYLHALGEIRKLVSSQEQARLVRSMLSDGHEEMDLRLGQEIDAAQAILDEMRDSTARFRQELAELSKAARNAAGYEALARFELERRDFLLRIGDEAESRLEPLEVLIAEARALLAERTNAARLERSR